MTDDALTTPPFLLPKSRRELQPLLGQHGLRPNKDLGQCLLLDVNLLAAIVRDAGVGEGDLVLEIGPGPGTLTELLLRSGAYVCAVDIDRGFANLLQSVLGSHKRFALIHTDVMGRHNELHPDVSTVLKALWNREELPQLDSLLCAAPLSTSFQRVCVVANLPYQISAPVLVALLELGLPIVSMTLLLQLEVARKLSATSGDADWGLLSLLRALRADCTFLRKVPANCFWPRPKVDSGLVQLTPRRDQASDAEYEAIKHVASSLFRYRRKTLLQGAKHGLELSGEDAKAWFERAGVDPRARVEQLTLDELKTLAAKHRP